MTARRTWLVGTALVAAAVFALLWIGYTHSWSWLDRADAAALEPMYRVGVAHPGWVTAWDVYCSVFSPVVFRVVGVVVIVVALVRRRRRTALFLLVTVEFSGALTQLFKELADRPRPATALAATHSSSFPSGHAVGVLVCVLAILTVGLPMLRPRWRGWAIALGVFVIVTIGCGRVVLNVHHPSDVVAGWALGYVFFVACLLAIPLRPADGTPAAPDTGHGSWPRSPRCRPPRRTPAPSARRPQ